MFIAPAMCSHMWIFMSAASPANRSACSIGAQRCLTKRRPKFSTLFCSGFRHCDLLRSCWRMYKGSPDACPLCCLCWRVQDTRSWLRTSTPLTWVSRWTGPVFYFLGIRADLARATQAEAQSFCKQVWSKLSQQRLQRNKALHGTPVVPLWERLLSDDSELVIAHRERCLQRWNEAKQAGFPESRGKCKWKQTHREWEEGRELKLAEGNLQLAELTPDKLHLHLPRERDAWWKLIHTFGEPVQVIADISQSLGRMPCRTDGVLPTITPGSHIVVGAFGRTLISHEKLLLHGLPLHRMVLPKEISDSELESMGGNMMHLQTVAVAMVVALSLVDWSQPHAHSFVPAPVFPAVPAVPAIPAIPAVPASAATKPRGRKAKHKKPSAAGTKLECQLKARFGIGARTAPSARVRRATKRVAKTKRCPKAVECLRGTRWASKRL